MATEKSKIVILPGYCTVDTTHCLVYMNNEKEPKLLLPRHARLFNLLYENKNMYVTTKFLAENMGKNLVEPIDEDSVKTYILELRRELGDNTKPFSLIKNRKDVGYKLEISGDECIYSNKTGDGTASDDIPQYDFNVIREEVLTPLIDRLLTDNTSKGLPTLNNGEPTVEPIEILKDSPSNKLIATLDGVRKEYDIYFTFINEQLQKGYIAYTDHSLDDEGRENLYVSCYIPSKGWDTLYEIEYQEEIDMVNEVITRLRNGSEFIVQAKDGGEDKTLSVNDNILLNTKGLPKEDLIHYLINKINKYNDVLAKVNLALFWAENSSKSDDDWQFIDKCIESLKSAEQSSIIEIEKWGKEMSNLNDANGYMVHLLLLRHGLIESSSLGSIEHIYNVLKHNNITIPSYMKKEL